ncbi:MAG: histidine triad nucleotide-binding protein [Oscillospiraceae bacterium]
MGCLFCSIANGEIPSTEIYSDDKVYAFLDISPQAPEHIVVIPREHILSNNELDGENSAIIGHIFYVISKIAKERGFAESGYRIVNNCGVDGGQTVNHLHFHVLAGRNLEWPPG